MGLERDDRLHHRERRRIGAGLGAAGLAEDALDLRKLPDQLVLHLQQLLRLGHRQPWQRGGHVEQRAFVQRRHELRAEALVHRHGRDHHGERATDHRPLPAQCPGADGLVHPNEDPADRVMLLRMDFADEHRVCHPREPRRPEGQRSCMREHQPHRRIERDGEHGRDDHREVLRVRERLEQTPFLGLERQHGQEGDRDHQQREEARTTDFLHRVDDHAAVVFLAAGPIPDLQLLVGLLHDDDRRIDHGTHSDRDAAERHDVGAQPHQPHRDEGDDDRHGNRDDRDDRARYVPEEDEDHDRNDDQFLDERVLEGGDGALDQV